MSSSWRWEAYYFLCRSNCNTPPPPPFFFSFLEGSELAKVLMKPDHPIFADHSFLVHSPLLLSLEDLWTPRVKMNITKPHTHLPASTRAVSTSATGSKEAKNKSVLLLSQACSRLSEFIPVWGRKSSGNVKAWYLLCAVQMP